MRVEASCAKVNAVGLCEILVDFVSHLYIKRTSMRDKLGEERRHTARQL